MQGDVRKKAVGITYHITLCDIDFAQILHNDKHAKGPPLFTKMHSINGIVDVAYDHHLGPTIIISLDIEYDTQVTWINLRNILINYVVGK